MSLLLQDKEITNATRAPTALEFHAECLTCCTCRKSLLADDELRLGGKQGIIYCKQHGERSADKKGAEVVQERVVRVCGKLPPIVQSREGPGGMSKVPSSREEVIDDHTGDEHTGLE